MVTPDKPVRVRTAKQVFKYLGGISGVQELTGAKRTSVFNWRTWGFFPSRYYLVMITALRAKGYDAEHALWQQAGNHELAAPADELAA